VTTSRRSIADRDFGHQKILEPAEGNGGMISQSGLVRRLPDLRVSHSSTLSYAPYSSTRYREWHHQIRLAHIPQKSTMTIHIVPRTGASQGEQVFLGDPW